MEWTDEGMSWEADHRHAELVRKSFVVTGRSVSTPRVKDRLDDIEGETPLGKEAGGPVSCEHDACTVSISPVTHLIYRSTAVIWHARCNSRRIWMKRD